MEQKGGVDVVRHWLDIVTSGAPGGWLRSAMEADILDQEFEWTLIGSTPVSGTHRGPSAIQSDFFDLCNHGDGRGSGTQGLNPDVPRQFVVEGVHGLDDGRVVAFNRAEAVGRNGVPYSQVYCWVIDVIDGRVCKVTEFCDTAMIERAMFDKVIVPAESIRQVGGTP